MDLNTRYVDELEETMPIKIDVEQINHLNEIELSSIDLAKNNTVK